jgi:hypothetical protein
MEGVLSSGLLQKQQYLHRVVSISGGLRSSVTLDRSSGEAYESLIEDCFPTRQFAQYRQYIQGAGAVRPFFHISFCLSWFMVLALPQATVYGVLPDEENPRARPATIQDAGSGPANGKGAGNVGKGQANGKENADADGGWVSMEKGSRPAYVGIHGGTAPLSLLRSPEGDIFALTGNTGNDFSRILRNDIARNATKLSADAAAATFSPLQDENLRPFGLSNPPGFGDGAGAPLALESYPAEPDPLPAIKPLRLRSYLRALSYRGGL